MGLIYLRPSRCVLWPSLLNLAQGIIEPKTLGINGMLSRRVASIPWFSMASWASRRHGLPQPCSEIDCCVGREKEIRSEMHAGSLYACLWIPGEPPRACVLSHPKVENSVCIPRPRGWAVVFGEGMLLEDVAWGKQKSVRSGS
jgi:hypothetical protein